MTNLIDSGVSGRSISSNRSVFTNIKQIFAVFLLFSAGYLVCYYQDQIILTTSSLVKRLPAEPAVALLQRNCPNLERISTADELPKLCDTPSKRMLNQVDRDGKRLKPDDPRILNYIRDNCHVLLRPPDGIPTTYSGMGASMGQDEIVLRILNNMTGGFFVEFGALDGSLSSNTLRMERDLGWKGLLIEPGPTNLLKLHKTHRNAWISHSCVAPQNYPQEVNFRPALGQISQNITSEKQERDELKNGSLIRVQCFPLFSYLAALDVSVVDYLSVDVDGPDLDVLKTIPFDKVFIKVVTVEIILAIGGPDPTQKFMESKGFKTAGTFYHKAIHICDLIFVHSSIELNSEAVQLIKSRYYNKQWFCC